MVSAYAGIAEIANEQEVQFEKAIFSLEDEACCNGLMDIL